MTRIVLTTDPADPRLTWDEAGSERMVYGIQAFHDFMILCDVFGYVPGTVTSAGGFGTQTIGLQPIPEGLGGALFAMITNGSPTSLAIGSLPGSVSRGHRPRSLAEGLDFSLASAVTRPQSSSLFSTPSSQARGSRPYSIAEVVSCD